MVVSWVSSPVATWSCLILLLSVHLAMNHAAVRAVIMHTVNRQRANILISTYLEHDRVLTPEEVASQERIFEWDGVLRWKGSSPFAKAQIGTSLQTLLGSLAPLHAATRSISGTIRALGHLCKIFDGENYLLWYDAKSRKAYIVLKTDVSPRYSLKAWAHALLVAHRLNMDRGHAISARHDQVFETLQSTLTSLSKQWDHFVERLMAAGWDIEAANLETMPSTRIAFA